MIATKGGDSMADIGKLYGAHGRTAAGIGATVGQK